MQRETSRRFSKPLAKGGAPGVDRALSEPVVRTGAGAVLVDKVWAMMLLGFAGIGFMAYRRKSKPALLAA
jgi:hypothetical protein